MRNEHGCWVWTGVVRRVCVCVRSVLTLLGHIQGDAVQQLLRHGWGTRVRGQKEITAEAERAERLSRGLLMLGLPSHHNARPLFFMTAQ